MSETTTNATRSPVFAITELSRSVSTWGLRAASRKSWNAAFGMVLSECDRFTQDMARAKRWCYSALHQAEDAASIEWARRCQHAPASTHETLRVDSTDVAHLLHQCIAENLGSNAQLTGTCTLRQHYLVTQDLAWLCHTPALILDEALRHQLETRHPGILAMAEVIPTLCDDQDGRRQALHDWLAQEARQEADINSIGALTLS